MQQENHTKYCVVCGKTLLSPDIVKKRRSCSRGDCSDQLDEFLEELRKFYDEITDSENPSRAWGGDKKNLLNQVEDFFPLQRVGYRDIKFASEMGSTDRKMRLAAIETKNVLFSKYFNLNENTEPFLGFPPPSKENTVKLPDPAELYGIEEAGKVIDTNPLPEGVYLADLPGFEEERG